MRTPTIFTVLLALVVAAAPASADDRVIRDCSRSANGLLTGTYTKRELTNALKGMDGDTADYTNCAEAIRTALDELRARRAGSGGGADANGGGLGGGDDGLGGGTGGAGGSGGFGGGSGDGGATGGFGGGAGATAGGGGGAAASGAPATGEPATPAAPQPPATDQPGSSAPVQLAGTAVTPSVPGALAAQGHDLPTPLIAFLALLGGGAIAVAGTTIGRRAFARRRA